MHHSGMIRYIVYSLGWFLVSMTRIRSRSVVSNPGHVYRRYHDKWTGKTTITSDVDGSSLPISVDWMLDEDHGDHKTPNSASSTHVVRKGGTFTGHYFYESPYIVEDWTATQYRMTGVGRNIPSMPPSTVPVLGDLAMQALGKTSPGKPHMSLPVAIGELRDLPGTVLGVLNSQNFQSVINNLRGQGRYRKPHKLTPRNYREYSHIMNGLTRNRSKRRSNNSIAEFAFGLEPLIADIVNLFSVPKFVDDRIDRLRANAGVLREHRTVHKSTTRSVVESNIPFQTAHGINVRSQCTREYTESARATVVWTPRNSFYRTSDQSMRDYVLSSALGLTPAHIVYSMWELLPWSWLIDWFGNTGDMLAAQTSVFDYSADVTISVKRRLYDHYEHTSVSSWGSAQPAILGRESWDRYVHVTPLWAPIRPTPPILSAKQLLILLGIADNFRGSVGA